MRNRLRNLLCISVCAYLVGCASPTPIVIEATRPVQRVAPLAYPQTGQTNQPPVAPSREQLPTKVLPTIEIKSPPTNFSLSSPATREWSIAGIVRRADRNLVEPVIVVHPLRWSPGQLDEGVIWVQPTPRWTGPGPDGDGYGFVTTAYFGEPEYGPGESFEVFAILAPRGQFTDGQRLQELPHTVNEISNGIIVYRPK